MELFTDLVTEYRDFAEYAAEVSPTFHEWARSVTDDPKLQEWIGTLPQIKRQPNLVFAAARWHGVAAPGPYSGLRDALLGDDGTIRRTILSRATQTNEAGRLATLMPAFAQIADGRPIALVEVGASAGLCLYPDRWRYVWERPGGATVEIGEASAPALHCRAEGDVPLPDGLVDVVHRSGLDLNPLDVHDEDAMRWLMNLVWPEEDERRSRLTQAIAIARADPPSIVAGDLLDDLPRTIDQVREAAPGVPLVVFHSAVVAYVDTPERCRFDTMMRTLVDERVCHWVSNEGPRVLPGVTGDLDIPSGRLVLGIDGHAAAITDGHGRSVTWL